MLEINYEIRKGILFVRLEGNLNKKTVHKMQNEITDMIKDNGIRNVVFNLENLSSIDIKGINNLLYNYEICHSNGGNALICGIDNNIIRSKINNARLLNYLLETSNELSAFEIIKI